MGCTILLILIPVPAITQPLNEPHTPEAIPQWPDRLTKKLLEQKWNCLVALNRRDLRSLMTHIVHVSMSCDTSLENRKECGHEMHQNVHKPVQVAVLCSQAFATSGSMIGLRT